MRKLAAMFALSVVLSFSANGDTVILNDGSSYTGEIIGGVIHFTDQQGIQYTLPRGDVQTLVFNASVDTVTLRNGKIYVGHFAGSNPIDFTGGEGISYKFPIRDVESLVFNDAGRIPAPAEHAKVLPFGTNLVVRTDENIESSNAQTGQLYRAIISEAVMDAQGNQAIPAGASAQLLIRQISTGGAVSSPELVLDL